jgi:excisionase family DNA binding protein
MVRVKIKKELYSVNDVAEILGVSRDTIVKLIRCGQVKVKKIPGIIKVLIPREEIEKLIN